MTEIKDKPNLNKYESWIWVELLAFDNAKEDQGVGAYLDRLGFIPYGISLMASASDFIMLHAPLETEKVLFPDICTRFGHAGNEERSRQDWTNYQLHSLIKNLQLHGIEVFVSVFAAYHRDKFHHEWATDHPEVFIAYDFLGITDGIDVLARLNDGTYYEDIFVSKLAQVMQDYGFNGWHGPDALGPSGALVRSDCSDSIMAQFAEYLGNKLPAEWVVTTGHDIPKLQKRMDYIWNHLWHEWVDFNMLRWESFWRKIVNALRPLGKKTMINSSGTRAAFESINSTGMDYRQIAAIGVDYLVVETVAANLSLIDGGPDRHFDFAATLAEMKAFVPGMKIIFLHGVKDVVESYDLMRHAPGRLEREVFTLSNQYYCEPDSSLKRCADGFMVCLGDGISSTEWAYLQKQWNIGYSFDPVRTGNLTWIFDDATVDRLREDCFVNGTWPGFKQIELLTKDFDLQISCISRAENVHQVSGPVIVPNFDLCAPVSKRKILADDRSRPLVLFGNMTDFEFSPNVLSVSSPITKDYTMGCIILNSTLDAERIIVPCDGNAEFVRTKPPRGFGQCKYMNIPDEFWRKSVELIKRCINTWEEENSIKNCQALNLEDGLRVMSLENSAGILRTALMSCSPTYIKPKCRFNKKLCAVEKITSFPYTPFVIVNDTVVSGHNLSPLHIPPYGIIAMDLQFHKEDL